MNKRLKITYIIDNFKTELAGTENQLLKMIKGLDKEAFEVELITFANNPWFRENSPLLGCGTRVFEINRFKSPATYLHILQLVTELKKTRPDIVQTFFPVGNSLGVIAARLAGVRNIISSRRDFGEWMSSRYLAATRSANRFVKAIIVNSEQVKELTVKREHVVESKIKIIYNGIDTDIFDSIAPTPLSELGIPAGNKVVGIVANFRPMKHHRTFILAANEVLKQRKDLTFVLIGTGELKGEAEELARSLKIQESVLFTGATKEVRKYLSVMDVGVNCSEGEGLSNAIIEYMAAGVPCVVSDGGGNPDLIKHGHNGYIFRVDDHGALAAHILKLLEDRETRQRFIKNSLKRVKDDLCLKAMLSKHEQFYKELCLN